MEYRLRRHDGEYRWIFDTGHPRFTPAGVFAGYIGSSIDITDRRRAEEALVESEARYRVQVEHAPEAIVVFDVDTGRFIEVNENAVRLYGLPREALLATGPAALSPPNQPDGRPSAIGVRENIQAALDGGTPVFEWTHRDAAGRDVPCEVRLVRLPSAGRRLVRGSVTDISQRKDSEKVRAALYSIAATTSAAEDLDEFYAAIHRTVGELMYARNFYVALHDPVSATLSFPYCVDEVDPPPSTRPLRKGLTEKVLRTGEPLLVPDEEFSALIATGEVESVGAPSVDWLGVPLKSRGRTFGVLVVQSYDPRFRYGPTDKDVLMFVSQQIAVAIDRKRAQEAVRESEERYRLLFERNLAGVYRVTLTGRILECNDALAHMFGYRSRDDLIDRDVSTLYPAADRRREFLDTLLRDRSLVNHEMRGQRRDGSPVWTLENAALLADERAGEVIVEGTVTDITDRKHLEEQLRQSQKMEAIGQLAGGIAHDFNNLLTTVLGYSNMALNQLSPHEPLREEIEEIQKAGERAANLTRQLLAFSRKQLFEPKLLDVNALIAEATRMLSRLIGENIRLVTQLDPSLGSVRADPGQLEQVLVNLVVNARDAMADGGTLTIRTQNAEVDAANSRLHFGAPAGRYVVLSVVDIGRRHRSRGPEADLRALLHDQGEAARHGARSRDRVRHRAAERRPDLRRERAGARRDLRDLSSARRSRRRVGRRRRDARRTRARLGDDPPRRGRGGRARPDAPLPRAAGLLGAAGRQRRRRPRASSRSTPAARPSADRRRHAGRVRARSSRIGSRPSGPTSTSCSFRDIPTTHRLPPGCSRTAPRFCRSRLPRTSSRARCARCSTRPPPRSPARGDPAGGPGD